MNKNAKQTHTPGPNYTPGKDATCMSCGSVKKWRDNYKAENGAMILGGWASCPLHAAAPELLEAAKKVTCGCSVAEAISGHHVDCAMPELIAAIQKAEGRS